MREIRPSGSEGGVAYNGHPYPYTSPGRSPGYGTQPERSEGTPHTPGCSHLFCGGRVPGLALGLVGGGGSAGSVLRSQGTLGPAELSRCRARGIRVSTFLCSLRPDPAAASWIGGLSLYELV